MDKGIEPQYFGLGPVDAIRKALAKAGRTSTPCTPSNWTRSIHQPQGAGLSRRPAGTRLRHPQPEGRRHHHRAAAPPALASPGAVAHQLAEAGSGTGLAALCIGVGRAWPWSWSAEATASGSGCRRHAFEGGGECREVMTCEVVEDVPSDAGQVGEPPPGDGPPSSVRTAFQPRRSSWHLARWTNPCFSRRLTTHGSCR